MSWRVVSITSRAKLDYSMDYLVIRLQDEKKKIHLSEIGTLLVDSTAVSLTSYLLCELLRRKIQVIFCDEKRLPVGSLLPLHGSFDSSLKVRTQAQWQEQAKAELWAAIIGAKIFGQATVLEYF